MRLFYDFFEFFTVLGENVLFFYLILHHIPINSGHKKWLLPAIVLNIILTQLLDFLNIPIEAQQLLHLGILILLTLFFTSGLFSEQLYWSCIFLFSGAFSDYFVLGIFYAVFHVHFESVMAHGMYRIPAMLCYLLILALLTFLLTFWLSTSMVLPFWSRLITLSIPLLSVLISEKILILGVYLLEQDFPLKMVRAAYLVNMLFLCLSLFLFLLTHYLGHIFLKNLELQKMNQEKQTEQAQFDLFQDTTQKLRVWKHDFRNHLLALNGYLQKNETSEATAYLNSILDEFEQSKWETFSGNSGLDALLSIKCLAMEQEKIRFQNHIFLPDMLPVSNLEFSALIGNALDNAIEACRHLKRHQTPWISLEIRPIRKMLLIQIGNSSSGIYHWGQNDMLLSLKNSPEHGCGLERIHEIAEKSGGFVHLNPQKETFFLEITLPLKGDSHES